MGTHLKRSLPTHQHQKETPYVHPHIVMLTYCMTWLHGGLQQASSISSIRHPLIGSPSDRTKLNLPHMGRNSWQHTKPLNRLLIFVTPSGCLAYPSIWLLGDDKSIVTLSTILHSTLNKCWNTLSYHKVHES